MKVTCIGHQSWMLSSENCNVLIDPILDKSFGSNENLQFLIFPRREVSTSQIPEISAVLLTTEHIQHFQPRTFKMMAKLGILPEVYVHEGFPNCAIKILDEIGFSVLRVSGDENTICGPFSFSFYSNSQSSIPWDYRVASIYVEDVYSGIVIQSDTFPSDELVSRVNKKSEKLSAIFATNNGLILKGNSGAGLTNILPIQNHRDIGQIGVRNLVDSLLSPFVKFPLCPNLVISGGGFQDTMGVIAKPKWTHEELAKFANLLSLGTQVHAPKPGQSLELNSNDVWKEESWIKRKEMRSPQVVEDGETYWNMAGVLDNSFPLFDYSEMQGELSSLSKALIMSRFGTELLKINKYLGRAIDQDRFVIQVVSEESVCCDLVLDMQESRFTQQPFSGDNAMRRYPFGMRVMSRDFLGLFHGDLQVWELSMISGRQWYVSDRLNSPMAFLYEYFNEAIQQGIYLKNYRNDLKLLT